MNSEYLTRICKRSQLPTNRQFITRKTRTISLLQLCFQLLYPQLRTDQFIFRLLQLGTQPDVLSTEAISHVFQRVISPARWPFRYAHRLTYNRSRCPRIYCWLHGQSWGKRFGRRGAICPGFNERNKDIHDRCRFPRREGNSVTDLSYFFTLRWHLRDRCRHALEQNATFYLIFSTLRLLLRTVRFYRFALQNIEKTHSGTIFWLTTRHIRTGRG